MEHDAEDKRYIQMKAIRDELLSFSQSPLYTYRTENNYFPVIGEGSHYAHIMIIGEAPGKTEAETARPFCGRSGKFLDTLLQSIGCARHDVYITNLVKDRPPENRDPTGEEIALYAPFLDRQIDILEPKVIATLGRFSMKYIMEKYNLGDVLEPIGSIHGRTFSTTAPHGSLTVVPLYHPAVALYQASMRDTLTSDFSVLRAYLQSNR